MKYRVRDAEGKVHVIDGPEGATPEEIEAAAAQVIPKVRQASRPLMQDLAAMRDNLLPSAANFAGGIAQAVLHPIDTASSAFDMAAGALRNATPEGLRSIIDKADTPENQAAGRRASETASAVGRHYADRYGGLGEAWQTAVTDPVGVAADAASVLTGGAGLASKAGMARTAGALRTAGNAVNPLSVVSPAVKLAAKVTATPTKAALGMLTGTSAEPIAEAVRAGVKNDPSFRANLRGQVPLSDVLDEAKRGVQAMGAKKSAEYRANMAAVSGDATVLKFDGIDKALSDATGIVTYKGQVKYEAAANAVQKMADTVDEWKALKPTDFHTPEGMDALKQKLGGIMESIPFEEKSARLAAGKVYNAVKNEIVKQAPTYAKTMQSFSEASKQLQEIERALSLGGKASADTAMRKLQSLMRNNVQTNYGSRLDLAKTLEGEGGVSLLPSLAGQALNSWEPRSLSGKLGGMGAAGAALYLHSPLAASMLLAQSPRLVGEAAYLGGRGYGLLPRGALNVGGLAAGQFGLLSQEP